MVAQEHFHESDDFLYQLRVQPPLELTNGPVMKLKLSPKTTRSAWMLRIRRAWPAFVLLAGAASRRSVARCKGNRLPRVDYSYLRLTALQCLLRHRLSLYKSLSSHP